jgi:hypothetical protein
MLSPKNPKKTKKEGKVEGKGKNPPRIRMVIDGVPVSPFNRDTQKLREEEAKNFGPLHPFNC